MDTEAPDAVRRATAAQQPNSYTNSMLLVLKNNAMKILVTIASIGFATLSAFLINNQQIQVLRAQLDSAQSQIQLLQNQLDTAQTQIQAFQSQLGTAQSQIQAFQSQLATDQAAAALISTDVAKLNTTVAKLNIVPLLQSANGLYLELQNSTASFKATANSLTTSQQASAAAFSAQLTASTAQFVSASSGIRNNITRLQAQMLSANVNINALQSNNHLCFMP